MKIMMAQRKADFILGLECKVTEQYIRKLIPEKKKTRRK